MLQRIFIDVVNMSLTASYVIAVVFAARILIKKAPKVFSYALWSIALFRLLIPFSFESVASLIPVSSTPVSQDIAYNRVPTINTGITVADNLINNVLPAPVNAASGASPIQMLIFIGTIIWGCGILAMLVYFIFSLIKLKRSLIAARPLHDNIYLADHIPTPFVMGFLRPKIYLPSSLSQNEQEYIIRHEMCHIKRFDHITRIVAFIALSIHWFNPFVWLAFVLSGKDMEMSCDEMVMKTMDSDIRTDYSQSLLRFSTARKVIYTTPLAFGEGNTKSRVKNVLIYKKPKFWVVLAAAVACIAAVFCLVSNPESKAPPTLYAYSEQGVIPMNIGTYSWNGVLADAIPYTEMEYDNVISYNEGFGHRNANIFFSTSNKPSDFNSDNAKGTDKFEIVGMKRYVDGKEEVLSDFGGNLIEVSLETDKSYLYEFKIKFGENYAYYSIKINNNVKALLDDKTLGTDLNSSGLEGQTILTKEAADEFIRQTLNTFELNSDDTVSFTLPNVIPTDESGKTKLYISSSATFSPEAGTSSVQEILDMKSDWQGGESYTEKLDMSNGKLTRLFLRVAFMTTQSENAYQEYAADYLELTEPFKIDTPVSVTDRSVEISTAGTSSVLKYTMQNGDNFSITLMLPQGLTMSTSEDYPEYASNPDYRMPTVVAVKDAAPIGTLTLFGFGTDDKEVLSQVDTAENTLPMQIFSPVALSNHVQYENYNVCKSSATGANATAKYSWQDLTGYEGNTPNAPWLESDCILAYDYEKAPFFINLILTDGSLSSSELKGLAESIVITD